MKNKLFKTTLVAGIAAAAGAMAYKFIKEQKSFSHDKWDIDINKRYRMADSIIRSDILMGKNKNDVLSILGINGLKSNTEEAMEYYLNQDKENPKLLIIEFENDVVVNVTACV